jgi:hypothetical protein
MSTAKSGYKFWLEWALNVCAKNTNGAVSIGKGEQCRAKKEICVPRNRVQEHQI